MTIIIGIKDKKNTYLATDSQWTKGQIKGKCDKIFVKELKVIDSDGQIKNIEKIYFAETGDLVNGEWVKYVFDLPDKLDTETDIEYLINSLCYNLRKNMLNTGLIEEINSKVKTNIWFTIVYNKKIYQINNRCGLFIPKEDYVVDGSGEEIALGSLYTTKNSKLTVKERIKLAVESCDYHSIYVDGEVNIVDCK